MALNLKNKEVEKLAAEVAERTGETKTEAIRVALMERKSKLEEEHLHRREAARRWLEEEVWPNVPEHARRAVTKEEEEEILGFGPNGY